MDLSGNVISKLWVASEPLLLNYTDKDVSVKNAPNIAHSLDRNRKFFEKCPDHLIFRKKHNEVHPNREGQWNKLREWRSMNDGERAKTQLRNAEIRLENERIHAEKKFVKKKLAAFMQNVRHFLSESGSQLFVAEVARRIAEYLRQLAQFDPLSQPFLFGPVRAKNGPRRPITMLRAWTEMDYESSNGNGNESPQPQSFSKRELQQQKQQQQPKQQQLSSEVNYFYNLSVAAVSEASSAASIASATIASSALASIGSNRSIANPAGPTAVPSSPSNLTSNVSVHSGLSENSQQRIEVLRKKNKEEAALQLFLSAHLSFLAAVFIDQGATATNEGSAAAEGQAASSSNRRLEEDDDEAADGEVHSSSFHGFLHPQRLQQLFQLAGLPVRKEDLQAALDAAADRRHGRVSLFK